MTKIRLKKVNWKQQYGETFVCILLFLGYWFLSSYEVYVSGILGPISRYYILLLIVYLAWRKRVFHVHWFQVTIIIWIIYYFASLLWTPNFSQAKVYVFSVCGMAIYYVLIAGTKFSYNFAQLCITMMMWCSGSLGVLGLFLTQNLSGDIESRRVLTLFGVQPDPNNLVALYAVATAITLYRLFFQEGNKWIHLALLLINSYGILMTGSRSGIVVLGAQFAIVFFLSEANESRSSKNLRRIALAVLIILAIVVLFSYLPQEVLTRITGQDANLSFMDATGRTERWMQGIKVWLEHPFFGRGWGAYECHSTFFTFLVDTGILGTLLFWGTVGGIAWVAWRKKGMLSILLMASGIVPALLIGAQNRRFFWNALIVPVMLINAQKLVAQEGNQVGLKENDQEHVDVP